MITVGVPGPQAHLPVLRAGHSAVDPAEAPALRLDGRLQDVQPALGTAARWQPPVHAAGGEGAGRASCRATLHPEKPRDCGALSGGAPISDMRGAPRASGWVMCGAPWEARGMTVHAAGLGVGFSSHDSGLREDQRAVPLLHQAVQQLHHKHRLAGGLKPCSSTASTGTTALLL